MLFLCFLLFDYFDGTAMEKVKEELILSVFVGIMISALLVSSRSSSVFTKNKESAICPK